LGSDAGRLRTFEPLAHARRRQNMDRPMTRVVTALAAPADGCELDGRRGQLAGINSSSAPACGGACSCSVSSAARARMRSTFASLMCS